MCTFQQEQPVSSSLAYPFYVLGGRGATDSNSAFHYYAEMHSITQHCSLLWINSGEAQALSNWSSYIKESPLTQAKKVNSKWRVV